MTRFRSALAALAAAALVVPVAALSSPASAEEDGKHRHDLDTYKREAWIAVGGDSAPSTVDVTMFCDSGDYALDGMWKVDAHDGDDRTLYAQISRRNSGVKEQWDFTLVNAGVGRAQVKTFVTCLDNRTGERDGHSHLVLEGARADDVTPTTAGGLTELTASCASDEIPVSPSYALSATDDARLVESYPSGANGWAWVFEGGTGSAVASIYCIESTTSSADGHTHDIDADLITLDDQNIWGDEHVDIRLSARAHDEGNVGAFRIEDPATSSVVYLGQDAQGQVRGFRFGNASSPIGHADVAVWGFDKRTKKNS